MDISPIGTRSDGNRCREIGRAGGAGGRCLVFTGMLREGVTKKEAFRQRWEGVMSLDGREALQAEGRAGAQVLRGGAGEGKRGAGAGAAGPLCIPALEGATSQSSLSQKALQGSPETVVSLVCSVTSLGKCPETKVLDQRVCPF